MHKLLETRMIRIPLAVAVTGLLIFMGQFLVGHFLQVCSMQPGPTLLEVLMFPISIYIALALIAICVMFVRRSRLKSARGSGLLMRVKLGFGLIAFATGACGISGAIFARDLTTGIICGVYSGTILAIFVGIMMGVLIEIYGPLDEATLLAQ